ncbi:G-type lectin S-receptor-like serine/threonine-protein kinase LECRK2 [Tasmannia lanceolata]|uniref:G-type lectin S-receptor-like serine/threonine-protein kinase LECRK2 n=1 Tax=Tasmannia lanceolata TaxID=3420 RepID=UPI00406477F9
MNILSAYKRLREMILSPIKYIERVFFSLPHTALMASVAFSLFLLFLSATPFTIAKPKQTNITLGSSLFPTTEPTSWLSPSGLFAFGFYKEGNGFAVGTWLEADPNKKVVWTANRDDPPVSDNATLILTHGGWLLLRSPGGLDKNITDAEDSASSASLLDTGNFVLYDSNSSRIWESFDYPTDTILAGQRLPSDQDLHSSLSDADHSTGRFRLSMQGDGNLVLYPNYGSSSEIDAYWSTGIYGNQGLDISLYLNNSGQLYLVNTSDDNVQSVAESINSRNDAIVVYRATIEADGNFRLYSHTFERNGSSNMSISWSAIEDNDQCSIKGFCGFNSYCTFMDNQPQCICVPGFNFSGPVQRFQGCDRNISIEGCNGKENKSYYILPIKNVAWKESLYDTVPSYSEEDCRNECLRDCECGAAMLKDDKCMKLTLPLLYGRRDLSDPTTTFIKIGIGSSTTTTNATGNVSNGNGNFSNATEVVKYYSKKKQRMEILIVCIVLASFSLTVFVVSAFLIYRYQVQRYKHQAGARSIGLREEIALRVFSYDELLKATDGFKEELGRGAFGTVYKGALSNSGRVIAVKQLEKVIEEGEREFRAETRAIGRTHHRNLVRLLGFCDEGSHRLLVYEYMGNGSLANLIFKNQRRLDWTDRVRIATDIARGILYLHEDCEPHIIHCDIKPQNILMDDFWTAKISDFGLAKLLMPDQTRTFTGVRGTRGYLAPEWNKNTPISVKADVYSYGIVLLELVCCRRNVELDVADEEIILTEWVYSCFIRGELGKLLGSEELEKRMLERLVKVGLWCIQNEPNFRPSMKNVILMLEGNTDVPIPPSPASASSS